MSVLGLIFCSLQIVTRTLLVGFSTIQKQILCLVLNFCLLSALSHPLTRHDTWPAHKQRCKQTDKAQWKANDEGRMQIEELSVCKYDRLRMIADTERGLFDSIDCTQ